MINVKNMKNQKLNLQLTIELIISQAKCLGEFKYFDDSLTISGNDDWRSGTPANG